MATITQDMFDEAVKENMEEFEMTSDEAIEDTVKQFKAQGVDLSNVIVDLMASNIDPKPVTESVAKLKTSVKEKKGPNDFIPELITIKKECDKGLQYRVIAGKEGAYNVIIELILSNNDSEVLSESFKTLTALMTKQPDLLDRQGIEVIIKTIDAQKDENVLTVLLKWVKECCILHEHNRQTIMEAGILDHLKPLLDGASNSLLCIVLAVLRALVLDDDIRVEFGKAHEHARVIASDTLCAITALLGKFKTDEVLMNDLLLTISTLLVRTEFCKKVEDADGISIIKSAMIEFNESERVARNALKVLKALAGNDQCKSNIIKNGMAPLIVTALNKQQKNAQTGIVGLGCLAALTLRSPENSEALFKSGAPKAIVQIMQQHPDSEAVQRGGSWAIRNMVSRSRHQNKEFLNLGAEGLLRLALKKFKTSEYDFKAALRDLDCSVELKEAWTGKGGKITTEEKKTAK